MNDKQELVNAELVKDVTEAVKRLHDSYFDMDKDDWLWSLSIKIKVGSGGKPDTYQATITGHSKLHSQGYKYTFSDYLSKAISGNEDGPSLFDRDKNENDTKMVVSVDRDGVVEHVETTTGEVKRAVERLRHSWTQGPTTP